jgi:hypothetical protein
VRDRPRRWSAAAPGNFVGVGICVARGAPDALEGLAPVGLTGDTGFDDAEYFFEQRVDSWIWMAPSVAQIPPVKFANELADLAQVQKL